MRKGVDSLNRHRAKQTNRGVGAVRFFERCSSFDVRRTEGNFEVFVDLKRYMN